jgi:hypothetical protein
MRKNNIDYIEVTDEDFQAFDGHVRRFLLKAGLTEWCVSTERHDMDDKHDGECAPIFAQKKAIIRIGKTRHRLSSVEYIAAHEVAELILIQLRWMSETRYSQSFVDEYVHEAVNHIVTLLLGE